MSEAVYLGKILLSTFLFSQALFVLFLDITESAVLKAMLFSIMFFLGLRALLTPATPLWLFFSLILCILAGNYGYYRIHKDFPLLINITLTGLLLSLVVYGFLAGSGKIEAALFFHILVGGTFIFPFIYLFRAYLHTGEAVYLAADLAALLINISGLLDYICSVRGRMFNLSLWASFPLGLCTGYLAIREIRVRLSGSSHWLDNMRKSGKAYLEKRKISKALIFRERLFSSGYAASAVLHEFKNILFNIKLCADHGLSRPGNREKNRCFELIGENVEQGIRSTVSLLNRILISGREKPEACGAEKMLDSILRELREEIRREKIIIEKSCEKDLEFRARRLEVEQVLLNIMRNSIRAYREQDQSGAGRRICLAAFKRKDCAVIEISDTAGGIRASARINLFKPPSREKPASLGLYLSNLLVRKNGGCLEYVPLEGGSLFRLIFCGRDERT